MIGVLLTDMHVVYLFKVDSYFFIHFISNMLFHQNIYFIMLEIFISKKY